MKSALKAADPGDRNATFERQQTVMKMYSDNARTYIQLSSAALALTVTFVREILRVPSTNGIANRWLIGMWTCFLLSILTGAFYQYLAVKYLESCIEWEHDKSWDWLSAGWIYAVMLGTFYAGAILFTMYAIRMLR